MFNISDDLKTAAEGEKKGAKMPGRKKIIKQASFIFCHTSNEFL